MNGARINVNEREMSRRRRIDLGLAISGLTLRFGETRTLEEIAAYCGCSRQGVALIEKRALQKVRQRLGIVFTEAKE